MPSHIDPLRLRKVMGRDEWLVPEPFGPDAHCPTCKCGVYSK